MAEAPGHGVQIGARGQELGGGVVAEFLERAGNADPAGVPAVPVGGLPVGEVVAVGLGEQLAERRGGGGFVGAGLLEAARLAGDRVGSGVDGDPEGPAGKLLDVASGGGGHESTVTRNTGIRSTRPIVGVRIMRSTWEPPIGLEPMTYALREARSLALLA